MANIPAAHMRQFTPENLDDIETVVVVPYFSFSSADSFFIVFLP